MKIALFTYCTANYKDVTVMFVCQQISGNISEHIEVVGILTGTEYVTNFMLTYNFLKTYKINVKRWINHAIKKLNLEHCETVLPLTCLCMLRLNLEQ